MTKELLITPERFPFLNHHSIIAVIGEPLLTLQLPPLPSLNDANREERADGARARTHADRHHGGQSPRGPRHMGHFVREWRETGFQAAGVWLNSVGWPVKPVRSPARGIGIKAREPVTVEPVFLSFRIFSKGLMKPSPRVGITSRYAASLDPRDDSHLWDVLNLTIKAVCDGITDAGLWLGDEAIYIPSFVVQYAGRDSKNPRVELEIHRLSQLPSELVNVSSRKLTFFDAGFSSEAHHHTGPRVHHER